jgi:alpha-tubulin suppressor-like RCC1 family protein
MPKSTSSGAVKEGEKLRLRQVSCGCEFTVAQESASAGKIWAWGNNSQAQVCLRMKTRKVQELSTAKFVSSCALYYANKKVLKCHNVVFHPFVSILITLLFSMFFHSKFSETLFF